MSGSRESLTTERPISKLLVANRGEIALRIFRACRELSIATVAVYEPGDRALHARSADEAVEIESYLSADEHIRAAHLVGAQAVHPGYGFLAESADFAEAVEGAGLVYVGAPGAALRAGADKLAAKSAARAAGVPVLPAGDPDEIGFPLIVKAAAGGGGRGMRIVRSHEELESALAAAEREATAAFGDGTVFCERYVERPRHVEVQVIADAHGTVLALGERDCSVQRRHQKVVEESPSPAVDPALRIRLCDAAVAFARAVGYVNAGTAEFMLDGHEFYFLEFNGRIQVEHPVTELVTGFDLVRAQIEVAQGRHLPDRPPDLAGHAIEARLYAEDPRQFLPQTGRIERLRLPAGIRVDAGVEEGDDVGIAYDPMIAKLIASGATREQACDRLLESLDETTVDGVVTNLPFLRWLLRHPAFRDGEATTAFLAEHPPLTAPPRRRPAGAWAGSWRLNLEAPTPRPAPFAEGTTATRSGDPLRGVIEAPMPGTVIGVLVDPGTNVDAQEPLLMLEAMKMEVPVSAPYAARVAAVYVAAGDQVARGSKLVELSVGDTETASDGGGDG